MCLPPSCTHGPASVPACSCTARHGAAGCVGPGLEGGRWVELLAEECDQKKLFFHSSFRREMVFEVVFQLGWTARCHGMCRSGPELGGKGPWEGILTCRCATVVHLLRRK